MENLDLRLEAVFLWMMPFAAALSNLAKTILIFSLASSILPVEIRFFRPFSSFLRSDFIAKLCVNLVLSTRNLF